MNVRIALRRGAMWLHVCQHGDGGDGVNAVAQVIVTLKIHIVDTCMSACPSDDYPLYVSCVVCGSSILTFPMNAKFQILLIENAERVPCDHTIGKK